MFAGSVEMECVCRLCSDGVCSQALLKRRVFAGSVEMGCVLRLFLTAGNCDVYKHLIDWLI